MDRVKPAKIVKTVKRGPLSISIRLYADGRHGFDYKPGNGDREKVRLNDLDAAEKRARELLGAGSAGKLELLNIDPEEFAEFLRWKSTRKPVPTIRDAAKSLLDSKDGKGLAGGTLSTLNTTLNNLNLKFGDVRLDELTREDVEKWLNAKNVGGNRWNGILGSIVAVIRHARKSGLISTELHPVETIFKRSFDTQVEIYSAEEVKVLISAATDAILPRIILGAFCGLRPQEICPNPEFGKRGLAWENIIWERGVVEVPAVVSKVRRKRFAPLTDAAKAFLLPLRKTSGPISALSRAEFSLGAWAKKAGAKWKQDALRHSFASYRLALIPDIAALALELGNTPAIIHDHYLNLQHPEPAAEWFAIRPKTWNSMELSEPNLENLPT